MGLTLAIFAHTLYDWLGLVPQLLEASWTFDWPFTTGQAAIVYGILWRLSRTPDLPVTADAP